MKTPILILGHRRPKQLEQCLSNLQKLGAENIYASVDGPTSEADKEHEAVKQILKNGGITELQILPTNLGCKAGVEAGIDWFFEKTESGIIVEEDVLISESGLQFLNAGLQTHSNSQEVHMIGAHLPTQSWGDANSAVSSSLGTIWGWATWANRWKQHRSIPQPSLTEIRDRITSNFSDSSLAKRLISCYELIDSGKLDTWDFQWNMSILMNNGIGVLPPSNQVENIGIGPDALHTTGLHKDVCNTIQPALESLDLAQKTGLDTSFEYEWFRRLSGKNHELRTGSDSEVLNQIDPKENLKIASLNTTDVGGGAEKIFRQLIRTSGSGSNVIGLVKTKKSSDPNVIELAGRSGFQLPFSSSNILKRSLENQDRQVDLIHVNNLHDTGVGVSEILSIANSTPVIWTVHDQWLLGRNKAHPFVTDDQLPGSSGKLFNHPNIHFVAPSLWLQDLIFEKSGRLPFLIRHGVDTSKFFNSDRAEACQKLDLNPDRKYLLFVANNPKSNPYKDYQTLLEAWKKVNSDIGKNGVDLICLGDRTASTETIDGNQLISVHFTKNEELVAQYLNAASCLVHATKSDVSSLSILEAFACQTPVIASAIGGIPELLQGGRNGRMFRSSNVEDLAHSITDLLQNDALNLQMVAAAHSYVLEKHHSGKSLRAYLGLYSKVTK